MKIRGDGVLSKNIVILLIFLILLIVFISYPLEQAIASTTEFKRINLTKQTWHIREGFNPEELQKDKIKLSEYRIVKKFPVYPNIIFDVPIQHAVKEYTIFTEFDMGEVDPTGFPALALNIESIGENWEIYLNGKPVVSHFSINKKGEMEWNLEKMNVGLYLFMRGQDSLQLQQMHQ